MSPEANELIESFKNIFDKFGVFIYIFIALAIFGIINAIRNYGVKGLFKIAEKKMKSLSKSKKASAFPNRIEAYEDPLALWAGFYSSANYGVVYSEKKYAGIIRIKDDLIELHPVIAKKKAIREDISSLIKLEEVDLKKSKLKKKKLILKLTSNKEKMTVRAKNNSDVHALENFAENIGIPN